MPDKKSKIKTNHNLIIREEEIGILVFSKKTGSIFIVNNLGKEILELCMQNRTLNEIREQIGIRYDINSEQLRKDINKFINEMLDKNFMNYVTD